jgi:glutaminyl-peptide cyclotransferase
MARRLPALLFLPVLAVGAWACGSDEGSVPAPLTQPENTADTASPAGSDQAPGTISHLRVEVLEERPHSPDAYTQGLVLDDDGRLFESTGLEGRSSVRELNAVTGDVLRRTDLDPDLFGEGLALVDDRLIQLTWMDGRALVYDVGTLEVVDEFAYDGEGWGLCYDGERLVMSDGSNTLTFRDPETFEVQGTVPVTAAGEPVERLNELECVDGHVWANVYKTDLIVEIDTTSGEVVSSVDAAGLLPEHDADGADVLNGIAYDAVNEQFLITGKLWPTLFAVRFV